MVLKLYIDYLSQPSRAVLAFCLFNNIPFEVIETQLLKKQTLSPEFTKINPLQKVPAIDLDGFTLFESNAILRYLAKKYPEDNVEKAAKVDAYLDFHNANIRLHCANYFFFTITAKMLNKPLPPSFDKEKSIADIKAALTIFQEVFLKNGKQDYIGEKHLCIGDLNAACEINQLLLVGFPLIEEFPIIVKWLRIMMNKKEMRKAHQQYFKFLEGMNPKAAEYFAKPEAFL